MSDINQPCPTICSACKGKCSDQLVLPAGCVLRPTIERVEAVLTPERVNQISIASYRDESQEAWNIALARAISREVVAILAEDQRELLAALQALRLAHEQNKYKNWERGVPEFGKAEALADAAIAKHSTPAASGIGESGGE